MLIDWDNMEKLMQLGLKEMDFVESFFDIESI
jgi:hypothetical protein